MLSDPEAMISNLVETEEGGWKLTNAQNDRGGKTFAGITEKLYLDWSKWLAVETGEPAAEAMPDSLDKDIVYQIYTDMFLDKLKVLDLAPVLRAMVFSCGVNCGVSTAAKLLQKAAEIIEEECDGHIGPQTIGACNAFMGEHKYGALNNAFVQLWCNHYTKIVENDPSQAKFLGGWHNRAMKYFIQG